MSYRTFTEIRVVYTFYKYEISFLATFLEDAVLIAVNCDFEPVVHDIKTNDAQKTVAAPDDVQCKKTTETNVVGCTLPVKSNRQTPKVEPCGFVAPAANVQTKLISIINNLRETNLQIKVSIDIRE